MAGSNKALNDRLRKQQDSDFDYIKRSAGVDRLRKQLDAMTIDQPATELGRNEARTMGELYAEFLGVKK
tara:strand:+ start:8799 stop:9005 length:207 start_codon:yes stop_codon:yes gene_type:complete